MLFQRQREGNMGLYVINAQFEHHGVYECEARTTIHTVRASAPLKVYGKHHSDRSIIHICIIFIISVKFARKHKFFT